MEIKKIVLIGKQEKNTQEKKKEKEMNRKN